jgi:hypothetical protein
MTGPPPRGLFRLGFVFSGNAARVRAREEPPAAFHALTTLPGIPHGCAVRELRGGLGIRRSSTYDRSDKAMGQRRANALAPDTEV